MIKIFRKIRQNLLMENKTGKYLKYALGEIILVVIGILIALNINNWNEHRKEILLAQDFLKNIRFDLKADSISFSEYIKGIPDIVDDAKSLLNSTELETLSANALFDKLPYNALYYKIKNQTFAKIVNSGITDFYAYNKLFDKINSYYTLDLDRYNAIRNWDYKSVDENESLWFNMGIELDLLSDESEVKDKIRFVQDEETRKKVFLAQLKLPTIRNSLKLNIHRKKRLMKNLIQTKHKADEIIKMIDEQLKD